MKISFQVSIIAVRWIPVKNEAEVRLAPSRRYLTREPGWCILRRLVADLRFDKKKSSSGVLQRRIEPNTVVSLPVLCQPAHVVRPDLEDRPERVRVERKAAPIALRRGTECRAERVRA